MKSAVFSSKQPSDYSQIKGQSEVTSQKIFMPIFKSYVKSFVYFFDFKIALIGVL